MSDETYQAWNNFVMRSEPSAYERGSNMRQAAIANQFMGLANNGGLNSFLTSTWELDAQEAKEALKAVGAHAAAQQLEAVLRELAVPLPAMSRSERWAALEATWPDELDEMDTLTAESDNELMLVLEQHVAANEAFYLQLGTS